ncbi:MAG: DUF45 domain-containing protein [Chloroflexi bacterium]|nr:DUF45 domain-containing protein [Chloroflexota bacterium]
MSKNQATHRMKYTVRYSRRARRVGLRVSLRNGLEIVLPWGFDSKLVPEIVERKRAWIERSVGNLEKTVRLLRPESLRLDALDEDWEIQYTATARAAVVARETEGGVLSARGAIENPYEVAMGLRRWLHRKAIAHLIPWLEGVSERQSIPFSRATVRAQKTRWASCSERRTISLNRSLLFLPTPLVDQVFIHELCHITHINHSTEFWSLVGQLEPNFKELEARLRKADDYVPTWASPSVDVGKN